MIQAGQGWQAAPVWVLIAIATGLLSFFSCRKVMQIALRSGMIALPGERQSHRDATPTGGGLGLVFSIVVVTLGLELMVSLPFFWWKNVLPGVMLLTIVGWRDDKFPVSPLLRLLIQLAVSIWLIGFGWWDFPWREQVFWGCAIVAVIWLMNLYNFMDGSNGMAGFQGVFAGTIMAFLFQTGGESSMALAALAVAAACAGFLPLNFPRARVFMGDASSVPLGFVFAAFAVYGIQTGSISLSLSILAMSVFFVDATLTLLSRAFRGERWYTAHAQHVYQRLIANGWSHQQVLLVYQAINVLLVLPAIALAKMYPQYALATVTLVLLLIGACWQVANWRLGMTAGVQVK